MTNNMVLGLNTGQTKANMLGSMQIHRKKVKDSIFGQMETNILEIGNKMLSMGTVSTNGVMAESIVDTG